MEPGRRWCTAGRTVCAAEIATFAQAYDPQALHLDAEWAAAGPFAGTIASGFQTLCLAWALWVQTGAFGPSSAGGIGLDLVRWTAPVRPGDTIRAEVEVLERSATPRHGRGRVVLGFTVRNGRGEAVLTFRALTLVALRPEPPA